MPEVSIIIPVYNSEKYVEKCIRSVMSQTLQDMEILVINDGSTDKCGEILEGLAAEDNRIRLFHQENSGVAMARNRGVKISNGKYITFVDGDDYLKEDYIEKMYNLAEKDDLDMVICGLTYVDESGKELNRVIPGVYKRFENEEWTFRISAVCSHLYRRILWEQYDVSFQNGERGEDMPISLFFSAVCRRINTIQECGYFYVQHASSAIHNFKGLENYSLPYKGLEKTIQKVQKTGIQNSPEFYELFVMRILSTCLFQLAPGASRVKMKELCDYIVYILENYFPKYYKNKKAHITAKADIPLVQKAAVKLLMILVRTRLLYPVGKAMSKNYKQNNERK